MILVLYAFPREIGPFERRVALLPAAAFPGRGREGLYGTRRLFLVETGIGGRAAQKTLLHTLSLCKPDLVISAGFAGAISRDAAVGDVILVARSLLSEGKTLAGSLEIRVPSLKAEIPGWLTTGSLITLDRLMKKRAVMPFLPPGLPRPVLCDMETYHLAAACLDRDIPFLAIRAVSDAAGTEIPAALIDVCDETGIYSSRRAIATLCRHPLVAAKTIPLFLHGRSASRQLCRGLLALLDILA